MRDRARALREVAEVVAAMPQESCIQVEVDHVPRGLFDTLTRGFEDDIACIGPESVCTVPKGAGVFLMLRTLNEPTRLRHLRAVG